MLDVIRRNSQSLVVKVIFGLIILSFVFWGATSMRSDSSEVIAKVNGENIYRAELGEEFNMEVRRLQQSDPGFTLSSSQEQEALAQMILNRMISKVLLRQEAKRLGISISNTEFSSVVREVPVFKDATGKFSEAAYKNYINAQGLTTGKFEEMFSDDLLMGKLQEYLGSAVTVTPEEARRVLNFEMERRVVEYLDFPHAPYMDKVKPTEPEIITYYSEHKEDWRIPNQADVEYLDFDTAALAAITPVTLDDAKKYYADNSSSFMQPESFRTRHILIRVPLSMDVTDEAVLEARKKADAARAELKAGKSFAEVAKKYSEDPSSKNSGGEVGWASKGQFDPSYEAAAMALKPGEISEPVRGYYGFHVIELLESKPETPQPFDEVKDAIMAQLNESAALGNMASALAAIEDSIIMGTTLEKLAGEYKVKVRDTGLMSPSSITALLELPQDLFDGVASMQPGTLFPTPIDYGKGFVVLRLKQYVPTYIPELEALRADVVQAIKMEGAQKLAEADAAAALKELEAAGGKVPAKLAGKLSQGNATRFTGMVSFTPNEEMTRAIYLSPIGQWLPQSYNVEEATTPPAMGPMVGAEPGDPHTVLLRVKDSLPVEESDWQQMSASYMQQLTSLRQRNMFDLLVGDLYSKAKIEIKAKSLFNAN